MTRGRFLRCDASGRSSTLITLAAFRMGEDGRCVCACVRDTCVRVCVRARANVCVCVRVSACSYVKGLAWLCRRVFDDDVCVTGTISNATVSR